MLTLFHENIMVYRRKAHNIQLLKFTIIHKNKYKMSPVTTTFIVILLVTGYKSHFFNRLSLIR